MEIDGVPKNFIENTSLYQKHLLQHFSNTNLDYTSESIEKLDSLLKDNDERTKIAKDTVLFYGLLAYCGQVIINEVDEGTWALYSYDEETNKPRYYPYIKSKDKNHEFYGDIDVFIEFGKSNMTWRLKQAINPIKLNVVPVTDWYFPPLKDDN